jgi:hypothetical protein
MRAAERQVRALVADVFVALIDRGLIENTATSVAAGGTALGLTREDLSRAARRHQEGDGLDSVPYGTWFEFDPMPPPPRARRAAVVELDTVETTGSGPAPLSVRPDRIGPSGTRELRCAGCGLWKPTQQFWRRLDAPGSFTARCAACLGGFVPAGDVSTQVDEAVGRVNLRFVLDGESNLVGVACANCDQALAAGDVAEGDTFLTHHECP